MVRLKIEKQNICKNVRKGFVSFLGIQFSPETPWIRNHIANCPRCQNRLASIGKVKLALSFIKSQSHGLDLLMRANTQTINVLKHSLREVPKAQKLKTAKPELKLSQKLIWCLQPSMNIAACLLILLLMKCGLFSSIDKFQTQGRKTYKQYYANQVGEEIAEDLFPSDIT
ncbi:MAG: hypothetical protein JXA96_17730 [Sedimentisphaerales bacterium]|nr:hypothetical protein [Sedimentisphaerales bacterium]